MTAKCFELIIMGPTRQTIIDAAGHHEERQTDEFWFLFSEDVDEALDPIVEPYGISADSLIYRYSLGIKRAEQVPWALIALDREYRLAGHLMEVKEGSKELQFNYYSRSKQGTSDAGPVRVSFIIAMNKAILAKLSTKTPLLTSAWNTLKDKAENKHWLCISDPLPEKWVKEAERIDDEILEKMTRAGKGPRPVTELEK